MGKKENTKSKYTREKIKIELTQYDGEAARGKKNHFVHQQKNNQDPAKGNLRSQGEYTTNDNLQRHQIIYGCEEKHEDTEFCTDQS